MARLSLAKRSRMPASKFAGPGKSFPINDPTHARLAISGATRSENAGNISASMASSIKAAARDKLAGNTGNPTNNSPPLRGAGPRPKDNTNPPGPAAPPVQSAMGNTGNEGANGNTRVPAASSARVRGGARDGLGHGKGGMALHPSMKGANAEGYERDHSSRTR